MKILWVAATVAAVALPTFARPGGFEAMAWGGHPHKPGAGGAPQWSPSRFCGNFQE